MDQRTLQKILQRYLKGKASEEEKRIVDAFYEASGKNPSLVGEGERDALQHRYWSVISSHILNTKNNRSAIGLPATVRTHNAVRYSLGIAASLLLLVISYSVFRDVRKSEPSQNVTGIRPAVPIWTTLDNPGSSVKQFDLPDGSRVSLEPQSQLKYQPAFDQTKREVFLEGEAHFEIAHNKERPFLVHAREVTTTVLGTSFRVKAFEGDKSIMVAVQTGRVSVRAPRSDKHNNTLKDEIILTPNQQIVYNKTAGTLQRSIVAEPKPLPAEEKTRRMRFEEAPVVDIFHALERVYGVDILFDKNRFASCVLTTSISDGGIYNRLDIICEAIGAEYEINEGQIMITGSGCD